MRGLIRDGVARGDSRQQVLESLVDDRVVKGLSGAATPAAGKAVAEAIRNDPALSRLFEELYAAALTERPGGGPDSGGGAS
ncbi:MAG: hypothetical protein AAF288_12815 [Planctomycetota bacterium]